MDDFPLGFDTSQAALDPSCAHRDAPPCLISLHNNHSQQTALVSAQSGAVTMTSLACLFHYCETTVATWWGDLPKHLTHMIGLSGQALENTLVWLGATSSHWGLRLYQGLFVYWTFCTPWRQRPVRGIQRLRDEVLVPLSTFWLTVKLPVSQEFNTVKSWLF